MIDITRMCSFSIVMASELAKLNKLHDTINIQ